MAADIAIGANSELCLTKQIFSLRRIRTRTMKRYSLLFFALGSIVTTCFAEPVSEFALAPVPEASPSTFREEPSKYWNFKELQKVPEYRDAGFTDSESKGLKSILFDGVLVEGKKSPVFAYLGTPKTPAPRGGYPGIVLIHGGGGTAFPAYVKLWNSYGYAVIALDWYNRRTIITDPEREGESQVNMTPLPGGQRQDHVANVGNMVLANSLLRSLPNVNKDKIGFVGLSWGSWYGSIVTAVDSRFRCGLQIYCGDSRPDSNEIINGRFLHAAKVPMYWIAGATDYHASPESLQRGWNDCPTLVNKSLVANLAHAHDPGFRFKAVHRMADYFLMGAPPLPKLGKPVLKGNVLSARILQTGKGIKKATLSYTIDREHDKGSQQDNHLRIWKTIPAAISGKKVSATLPQGTFRCFLSVYDEITGDDDCCGSSDLVMLK
jgi:dienelactone hydrolase